MNFYNLLPYTEYYVEVVSLSGGELTSVPVSVTVITNGLTWKLEGDDGPGKY